MKTLNWAKLRRVYIVIAYYENVPYSEDYAIVSVFAKPAAAEEVMNDLLGSGTAENYWIEEFGVIE